MHALERDRAVLVDHEFDVEPFIREISQLVGDVHWNPSDAPEFGNDDLRLPVGGSGQSRAGKRGERADREEQHSDSFHEDPP
ncbi:hypothetical protein SDC9_210317 [bioreactor metagenome]|uniref:Uncharacterized protein n=1 Tax=bioreactor metagenome TaxID=1076179 RepID=A0A645JFT7_9ZZZZ